MSAADFIKNATRDGKIIDALHVARYALVTHDGMTVECDGGRWKTDFSEELRQIDVVMAMLGIDLTQPLPAPTRWGESR